MDKPESKPNVPSAKTTAPKPSPALTKAQIAKSIYQKSIGPNKGKPIIGAGGLKPFRPPPVGTKAVPYRDKTRKPLRPQKWS